MQPQKFYLVIFLVISAVIIAAFWFVYASTKNPKPDWQVKSAYKLRGKFFYALAGMIIVITLFTLSALPYVSGTLLPDVVVSVEAQQFSFIIRSPQEDGAGVGATRFELPVNKLVEFRVTSKDVNHGFGIYTPQGELVSQVQAMPGYVNRLRVKFDQPGIYNILCLEYCGVAHPAMKAEIEIK